VGMRRRMEVDQTRVRVVIAQLELYCRHLVVYNCNGTLHTVSKMLLNGRLASATVCGAMSGWLLKHEMRSLQECLQETFQKVMKVRIAQRYSDWASGWTCEFDTSHGQGTSFKCPHSLWGTPTLPFSEYSICPHSLWGTPTLLFIEYSKCP